MLRNILIGALAALGLGACMGGGGSGGGGGGGGGTPPVTFTLGNTEIVGTHMELTDNVENVKQAFEGMNPSKYPHEHPGLDSFVGRGSAAVIVGAYGKYMVYAAHGLDTGNNPDLDPNTYGVAFGNLHSGKPTSDPGDQIRGTGTWAGGMEGRLRAGGARVSGRSVLLYDFSDDTVDITLGVHADDPSDYDGPMGFSWEDLGVNDDGSFHISGYGTAGTLHPQFGYVNGDFYGPKGQEIAGVFERSGVVGAFGGVRSLTDPTPAPAPTPTPSAGDRSDFFPIPSGHVTRIAGERENTLVGSFRDGLRSPAGRRLETLVPQQWTNYNFPQFSEFEFGSPTDGNGLPLQKATASQAGLYAAIAYQAVLEHSMFIAQGGIYNYTLEGTTGGRVGGIGLTTGDPYTGAPVAGTWKGKAVAVEIPQSGFSTPPTRTIGTTQAESRIVQGDIEIGVTLNGSTQDVRWEISDWDGGSVNYPTVTSEGMNLNDAEGNNNLAFPAKIDSGSSTWRVRSATLQFYGPGRAEAGGLFDFSWQDKYDLSGVFGAKKQ